MSKITPLSTAPPSVSSTRSFAEGKTFLITAIAFIACRYLTTTWLPALGLRTLAHQYENFIDFVAPYILLPICLVVIVQVTRRNILPGLLAIIGTVIIDYYFFIRFMELPSWLGLLILAGAVLWSGLLFLQRKKEQFPPPLLTRSERLQRNILLAIVYVVSFFIAMLLAPVVRGSNLPDARDLAAAVATLPTLLALLAYLLYNRLRPQQQKTVEQTQKEAL